MREIKFKSWDTKKRYFDYEPLICGGKCCFVDSFDNLEEYNESRMVLLQYTGLKDKNGVEIYEGDVFKAPHDFGPGGFDVRQAVVRWHEIKGYQWEYWLLDQLEVIGNIYENADLLK